MVLGQLSLHGSKGNWNLIRGRGKEEFSGKSRKMEVEVKNLYRVFLV